MIDAPVSTRPHQLPAEEQRALAGQVARRDFERVQLLLEHKGRFARGQLLAGSERFCRRAFTLEHHIGREESARSNPKVRKGIFISFSSLAVTSRTRNGVKPKRRAPSARRFFNRVECSDELFVFDEYDFSQMPRE